MIKIVGEDGSHTDITVSVLHINSGTMPFLVITDQADQEQIGIHADEIDSLIEALKQAKVEMSRLAS